jgi:predicted permease
MGQDLRLAIRVLAKDKTYAAAVILTLALCIGANAAIFAVVDAVLLRPLPFNESHRIVLIYNSYPNAGAVLGETAVPDYFDRRRETTAFEEQALYVRRGVALTADGPAQRVMSMQVTPSFFRLVRVTPHQGRFFDESEAEPGHERKVVLTHGFWREQYAGDPAVVGRDIRLDGEPYTIVGILPEHYRFLSPDTKLYTPLAFTPQQRSDDARHSNNWTMLARLGPGVSVPQAQAQIDALNARNLERFPHFREILVNAGFHSVVTPFQDHLVSEVRETLYLLWAGVGLLLLIGGVNVTNLVLVRSTARLKEFAMRRALGADVWRIGQQLLVETSLLTTVAGVLGLVVGAWTLGLLSTAAFEQIPRGSEIRMGERAVAFTGALALGLGALLGTLPLLGLRSVNLAQTVREGGRSGTPGRRARLVRRALVTCQVALAFMLLAGAGLLVASFERALAVDPGFDSSGVLTGMVSPPRARYEDETQLRSFASRFLERVRAVPGVTDAALASSIPFGGDFSSNAIFAEGYVTAPGESVLAPTAFVVTPGYFEALRIPLTAGRTFTAGDADGAPLVAVVDEKLARRFWKDSDPLGKRLYLPTDMESIGRVTERTQFITVVGVVQTVQFHGPAATQESVGAYYFPYPQAPRRGLTLVARTAVAPSQVAGAVQRELAAIDPELPFHGIKSMAERQADTLVNRRTPMVLAVFFAVVALVLAAIGIYGVLAYQVSQREREIGIRMALGSEPRRIFRLVLREGALMVALGFAVGLMGAAAIRGAMAAQLYGVGALDPIVLAIAGVTLATAALVACAVPARRAARVDPLVALADS